MDYDPARNKFLVQIIDTGVIKYVGRLSLLFFLEDPIKFRKRVEEARERQQTAEDEIRFLEYLDSLSDDAVSSLTTKVRK
jgi:dynein heavy chain